MKIQILSDIHREFYYGDESFPYISPEIDLLLMAGDITTSPYSYVGVLKSIRNKTSAPIISVLGNHEYFGNDIMISYKEYLAATQLVKDFYLLENSHFDFGDIRIIGSTLWTDYTKVDDLTPIVNNMPDFKYIDYGDNKPHTFANLISRKHKKSVQYLRDILQKSNNFKTVILSHHCPSTSSINIKYKGNVLTPCFATDLSNLIYQESPDLWVHGHVHMHCDYVVGSTRIIANPFGYDYEVPESGYIEGMTVEL